MILMVLARTSSCGQFHSKKEISLVERLDPLVQIAKVTYDAFKMNIDLIVIKE